MKFLILFGLSVVLFMCSFLTEARADIGRLFLLNSELRYERSSSQDVQEVKPLNLSFGYQFENLSALTEFSSFSESSGTEMLKSSYKHQEIMLWGRYHIFMLGFAKGSQSLQIYGGVGAGLYQESASNVVMSKSVSEKGKYTFMSGLSGGAEYSMRLSERALATLACEGRGLFSSDFDPNPLGSVVVRLGLGMFF